MEILAFDKASARKLDENGFLHVEMCNISKEAVNDYYGHEIPDWEEHGLEPNRIYKGYRPAEELEKAVETFNMLPLLDEHVEDSADDPQLDHRIGNLGSVARFKRPYLQNSLVFQRADAIERLNALDDEEVVKELSSCYRYDPVFEPGVFNGEKYDFRMTNIRGNHVAVVPTGRAGSDVVVADAHPTIKGRRKMAEVSSALISRFVNAAEALGIGPHRGGETEAKQILEGERENMESTDDMKSKDQEPGTTQIEPNTKVAVDMTPEEAEAKIFEVVDGIQDRGLADNLIMLLKKRFGGGEATDEDPDEKDKKAEDNVTVEDNCDNPEIKGKTAMDKKGMAADAAAIERRIMNNINAKIAAAEFCAPLAPVSPLAYDSAAGVYKAALSAYGKKPKTNDIEALREIAAAQIELVENGQQAKVRTQLAGLAGDSAPEIDEDFAKEFEGFHNIRTGY